MYEVLEAFFNLRAVIFNISARAVSGEGYLSWKNVSMALSVFCTGARNHGESGQNGRPMRRNTWKMNCRMKGILYASAEFNVPVPFRMRFAASWSMPMKSCTPDVVRPPKPWRDIFRQCNQSWLKERNAGWYHGWALLIANWFNGLKGSTDFTRK